MRELVCPRHMCKVPLGKCMEWDIDEVTGERIQCNEKPVMSTTLYWCKQCNVRYTSDMCSKEYIIQRKNIIFRSRGSLEKDQKITRIECSQMKLL